MADRCVPKNRKVPTSEILILKYEKISRLEMCP
jgi:hypothetical protein